MSQTLSQPKPRIKPTSVVYWMRVCLAIVAAFAEQLLHVNVATLGDYAQMVGIGVGIAFYLLSVLIVRHVLRYDPTTVLKGKNRDVTFGGGTFVMIWIMMTVLLNTLGVGW
jgi:membrane protein YdbS with pleckstrin-like domain